MFFIKIFYNFFIFLIVLTLFVCVFFIPTSLYKKTNVTIINLENTDGLLWPVPNYYRINSYFGKRNAPTSGASVYHKGIDISAPEGSPFVAVADGSITFIGFFGGGGYTITLTDSNYDNGEIKYSYCHCNPNFIVSIGDTVTKGQVIGNVGPKYVYNVPGNKYTDSTGKQTNGATTGPHLHFGMRINNSYVDPLVYLPN